MLDIGWPELVLIAVVALVVIGPKDLPKALHTLGKWIRKARTLSGEFQRHIDGMVREAELDELRQQAKSVKRFNIEAEMDRAIDPEGDVKRELEDLRSKADNVKASKTPPETVASDVPPAIEGTKAQ